MATMSPCAFGWSLKVSVLPRWPVTPAVGVGRITDRGDAARGDAARAGLMPWAEARRWLVAPEARRWWLTATTFAVLVAFTARPIGTRGHGLVTLCLLVLNFLLFVVRLLPDEVITPVGYRVLVLIG